MIRIQPLRQSPTSSAPNGVLEMIGSTPLVRMERYLDNPDVNLIVKLESFNPGGSAKDRPACQMIEHALETGKIDHNATIIESTSGNMGIGLSQVCRYHGLKLICVVDPNAQPQNVRIMQALGTQIVRVTHPVDGSYLSARWQRVEQLLNTVEGSFWPNQYANLQNPLAHQQGTIKEIDEVFQASDDVLDYLFVATSSTGTARGCQDYLRSLGRTTKVIAVDALGSVLFGGAKGPRRIPGLGAGVEPALAVGQRFDGLIRVDDLTCVIGCRRMAEREALLVGGSAGGVLEAIRSMQRSLSGKNCVAILHDSGTRYLETVFSDDWVEQAMGCTPETLARKIDLPASAELSHQQPSVVIPQVQPAKCNESAIS